MKCPCPYSSITDRGISICKTAADDKGGAQSLHGEKGKKLLLMLPAAAGKHQKEDIQRGMNPGSAHTQQGYKHIVIAVQLLCQRKNLFADFFFFLLYALKVHMRDVVPFQFVMQLFRLGKRF